MLRVRTLYVSSAAASAAYYTQYLVDAPGEVPGVWSGRQADGLGLEREVRFEHLQSLLEGRDPITGDHLGGPLKDRTLADGKVIKAVAGFDGTFSAPKSVSLWWALTGDDRVLEAHDVAVTAALEFLGRYGSTTRVRSNGRRLHPDSEGLTIATFRQATSRADDPQLHTHAVVSSKVQTPDGQWLALDARFLKRHQRKIGGLYQSVLRNELTHRFGVDWEEIVNGQAEIAGFPPELIDVFSKRAAQVETALAGKVAEFRVRQAREPTRWERAALTREAAADTRGHKTGISPNELRAEWLTEAARHGWTPSDVVEQITTLGRDHTNREVEPVTIEAIIEALTTRGSTWGRAEMLQAICDVQRPIPGLSGRRWAAALGRACDQVFEHCVDLDPTDDGARCRVSDGRSLWLDPSSPHITSTRVLAEEEHILSWAIDAHTPDPTPSPSVNTDGLDVLQADVAAAVAGQDRLVLAVGPAGAGKTTTLRAAVNDLAWQRRVVFGLSPTAKAARVLEREAGMRADTVAKLLFEWQHPDRPPGDDYRLPVGTTVIVDEAGMLGTGALHRLVTLAEDQGWRLVLIGDHRQLQAVGRGGLFHELCVTGRRHELRNIHRFTAAWEAAASLQLRHGDPQVIDVYEQHGRIVPGAIDAHLARIADLWLDTTADAGTVAITTTTNEHVDAINAAIQTARLNAGQLDAGSVCIGGGERGHVGDVVATRRNDRHLTTTTGETVRNRELWTVTATHHDGSLTVTPRPGHGHVTLPAGYVADHVRLGYAATEHGNQSDTVTLAVELATPATTCRGLYVAMSRGREQNLLLVVTEQPDLAEARDVLEAILATDRTDIPATVVRRQLARADQPQHSHRASPVAPRRRCRVPEWFDHTRNTAVALLAQAEADAEADAADLSEHQRYRAEAADRLAAARQQYEPHRQAIAGARTAVNRAGHRVSVAIGEFEAAPPRRRRLARRFVHAAKEQHERARTQLDVVKAAAEPITRRVDQAARDVRDADTTINTVEQLTHWSGRQQGAVQARQRVEALDTWQRWADGHDISTGELHNAIRQLQHQQPAELQQTLDVLATVLTAWAESTGVHLPPQPPSLAYGDAGLGIDL